MNDKINSLKKLEKILKQNLKEFKEDLEEIEGY